MDGMPSSGLTASEMLKMVRGRDPLHGLCETKQITPEACDWLKSSLDPFHDFTLENLRGYPDVSTDATVIVKVNQSVEVSAPAGLTAGANWDCHIVLSPVDWARPQSLISSLETVGHNYAGTSAAFGFPGVSGAGSFGTTARATSRIDGLVMNSVPSGGASAANMTFTPGHMPHLAAGGYAVENLVLDAYFDLDSSDYCVYRIVSSGFEVVNTTAIIHQQGAVTCYEYGNEYKTMSGHRSVPSPADPDAFIKVNEALNTFRCPPNSLADAKIMPNAHTWAAKDGCYCIAKFQDANPFQGASQRNYILQQNHASASSDSGYLVYNDAYVAGSILSPGIGYPGYMTNLSSLDIPATHFSQMNTAGAYFTGLSSSSTLMVTWRCVLERLPSANSSLMLSLAQPSAAFDPNALVLYNLICTRLAPGVPQGYNDIGKWFSMVSSVARNVLPAAFPLVGAAQTILNSVGRPAMATAIGGLAKAAQGSMSARSTPRPQQPRPAPQNFGAPSGKGGNKKK